MAIVAGVDRILDPTFQVDDDASSIRTALPPYTSRSGSSSAGEGSLSSYVFHLRNGKGRPWATLKGTLTFLDHADRPRLLTKLSFPVKRALGSASSVRNLPIFVEGLPIVGSFSVDLEAPDPVRSVELIVRSASHAVLHVVRSIYLLEPRHHELDHWKHHHSCAL